MKYILQNTDTGLEVKIGDAVKTFRGDPATLMSFEPGRTPESTGRVYIKYDDFDDPAGFYPSVINCVIVEVPYTLVPLSVTYQVEAKREGAPEMSRYVLKPDNFSTLEEAKKRETRFKGVKSVYDDWTTRVVKVTQEIVSEK